MLPVLATLLAGALCLAPQGFQVPANDGWVTDKAGLLRPDEERALEARMESYRVGSGQEIALLTLPDLGGRPLEECALAVARSWKIGDRETSAGALLLVSMAERELRIEVGRGLEGTLTDSVAGRIIRDVIVPEFQAGRFARGLEDGIEAIHAALGGDYGPLERARREAPEPGAAAALVLIVLFLVFARLSRGGRGRGSSALPWLVASQLGRPGGGRSGGFSSGGFSGFGGGGGFSGGGASGRW